MPAPRHGRIWIFRSVAILAVAIELLRVGSTIGTFNENVDEPFNIASAVALYGVGKHVGGVEQPPLPRIVAGLPLYFSGVRLPEKYHSSRVLSEVETFAEGDDLLFHSSLGYEQILWRTRLAMLVFPAIALLYVYLLGKWFAGEMVAMLAVIFFSTDPTLLGHSMWVCTDAAACAGFLAAAYHGLKWIAAPSMGRAIAAATAIALAISCKFSCGLVVPGLAVAMLIRPLKILRSSEMGKWRKYFEALPSLKQIAVAAIVGFFVLWGTYLFNVGPMENQSALSSAEWTRLPSWVRNTPIPMPSFPLGVLRLLSHNRYGHRAYLNGLTQFHGWWYYFPEAIVVKSPVALLLGIILAVIVFFKAGKFPLWPALGLILPPALFLGAAMKGNLDIGVRHVLPVLPFFYLLVCAQLATPRMLPILFILIGLSFIETAWVHPEYVSFFNFAVGGPTHGDRFLLDSNLDWGQDISQLARWLRSDEAKGKSYSTRLFMFPVDSLDEELGLDPAAQTRSSSELFIVSQTVRRGSTPVSADKAEDMRPPENFLWLEKYPLVKRIGYSILVYDIRGQPTEVRSASIGQ